MIDIDKLTIGEARTLAQELAYLGKQPSNTSVDSAAPWEIGKCYLIRTVTMIQTGECVAVYPQEIVLKDAAWVADTGRFSDALVSLDFGEVEPFPEGTILVGRGSVVDAVQIPKAPRTRK